MRPETANQRALLEGNIRGLESEIVKVNHEIREIQKKVDATPKREQELITLTRDYENIKSSYNSLLNRKLEADISVNMEKKQKGEQFQVIDPARLPERPASPDPKKLFLITIAAGLGLGGALIFLLDMTDNSVRKLNELEEDFGIAVLAAVPRIFSRRDKIRHRFRQVATATSIIVSLALTGIFALLVFNTTSDALQLSRVLSSEELDLGKDIQSAQQIRQRAAGQHCRGAAAARSAAAPDAGRLRCACQLRSVHRAPPAAGPNCRPHATGLLSQRLRQDGTIQRLLENKLIYTGGKLTPRGEEEAARLERYGPCRAAHGRAAAPASPRIGSGCDESARSCRRRGRVHRRLRTMAPEMATQAPVLQPVPPPDEAKAPPAPAAAKAPAPVRPVPAVKKAPALAVAPPKDIPEPGFASDPLKKAISVSMQAVSSAPSSRCTPRNPTKPNSSRYFEPTSSTRWPASLRARF